MFYFYYFFMSYDQWSLEEKTMDLNHTLINREALNERIRQLQVLRQNPGIQFPGIREVKTDGWVNEELEEVLSKGTSCLSNEKLDWLSFSPVALFQLHDAINEEMPDAWYGLMVEDAKELWKNRPLVSRLKELAVNREALINHIRELQKKDNFKTNGWIGEELERVLEKGIQTLSPIRQNWLINNPVALFQIYEAVNEKMPDAWMPAIQADANRLAIGNKRLQQKGVELFEKIKKAQKLPIPEPQPISEPPIRIFPPPITPVGIIPTAFAAASMIPSKQQQAKSTPLWRDLVAILQDHVKVGQVTTYGNCSFWMYGKANLAQPIVTMLETAAKNGFQELTNRVVNIKGECNADHHGQKAQLEGEGVPFIGDVVNLAKCLPVKLPPHKKA